MGLLLLPMGEIQKPIKRLEKTMSSLNDDWENYLSITSSFSEYEYNLCDNKKISKQKERYGGGFLFGDKVIGVTNSSRESILIDPTLRTIEVFGKTSIGTFKWTGGSTYKGKCYGFPRKENSILVIDPEAKTLNRIKLDISYNGEHHYGGIISSKGILYQPPRNTDHILCLDLNTFNFNSEIIPLPEIKDSCRYSSIIAHPNGNIYMIPEFGYRIAVLNPDTMGIVYFGEPFEQLVFGVVIGIDGNIYGFPKYGKGVMRINVEKRIVENICKEIDNPDCFGTVVGINGKLYGVPGNGNTIYEFDVKKQIVKALYRLDENGYAKCAGGALGPDGTIVFLPCFGECVYFLSGEDSITSDLRVNNTFMNTSY